MFQSRYARITHRDRLAAAPDTGDARLVGLVARWKQIGAGGEWTRWRRVVGQPGGWMCLTSLPKRPVDGGAGVQDRGIEERDGAKLIPYQQADFGAAENDGFGAFRS